MKYQYALIAGILFSAAIITTPQAATGDSQSFNVKIKISAACDIKSKTPRDVDFGAVSSFAATPTDSQGELYVTCTRGTPYRISLNAGANGKDIHERQMKGNGADTVRYQLYRNADRSAGSIWGDTPPADGGGGNVYSASGSGDEQAIPIYGRVATGAANVPAGDYLDTVTATITY